MICVDSDCIIDFLKGRKEAVQIIGKYKEELATTEVNVFEVYFSIYQKPFISGKEEKSADALFASVEVLSFDRNCGKKGAEIFTSLMKEGKIIDQNDVFIAAIALKNDIKSVITRNSKHFSNIKDLNIILY